jgi:hypothetical protein
MNATTELTPENAQLVAIAQLSAPTEIPAAVLAKAKKLGAKLARENALPWWWCDVVSTVGIAVVSAGLPRSRYRPGVKGWIVGGTERTVFLGESLSETKLPEFTVLDEGGGQTLCQYGKDVVFP